MHALRHKDATKMKSESTSITQSLWSPSLSEPVWLQEGRKKAWEYFRREGFPRRHQEGWRYTPLETLSQTLFVPPQRIPDKALHADAFSAYAIEPDPHGRLVILNGMPCEKASSVKNLPEGVVLTGLKSAFKEHEAKIRRGGAWDQEPVNYFDALNRFCFEDGGFLFVPEGQKVEYPIHFLAAAIQPLPAPFTFNPRIIMIIEKGASAHAVINCVSLSDAVYFSNTSVDIYLGEGARLDLALIARDSRSGHTFSHQKVQQSQDSHFHMTSFAHGVGVVRNETQVRFSGGNAQCEIRGLSLLEGCSQVYHHAAVYHSAQNCRSEQVYKNILAHESVAEFNSLVYAERGAVGTESRQLNKNLILSPGARVYSRPQLKIYADDVSCNHGSATGQLNPDELFYLRSRGISPENSRYLLAYGFAEEVLTHIQPFALRWQIENIVKRDLEAMIWNAKKESPEPLKESR